MSQPTNCIATMARSNDGKGQHMKSLSVWLVALPVLVGGWTGCEVVLMRRHLTTSPLTITRMGKGFNKARNKQAALAQKMAIAKQKSPTQDKMASMEKKMVEDDKLDEKTDNESKDRELFAKLLTTTKGAIPTDMDADSAFIAPIVAGKTKPKVKKKPKKVQPKPTAKQLEEKKKAEKLAERVHFEELVDIETSAALEAIGAAELVPWVPPFLTDCLVVFADPRPNSGDLRQTIKYLTSNLLDRQQNQIIFISADPATETKSWIRRSGVTTRIRMFADQRLAWMNKYKVVGDEHRWSMNMVVFDTDGRITAMERNVNPSHATQLVREAIEEAKGS